MYVLSEPIRALALQWQQESATLRSRFGEDRTTKTLQSLSDDLLGWIEEAQSRLLNLVEASEISGYSAGHLGRLIKHGEIPNSGRPNAPKIALRELPMKPGHLPSSLDRGDLTPARAEQIARSIVSPEEGHDG